MIAPQKILIVDYREEKLFALEKVLDLTGAEIIKAKSGYEALSASLNHDFALAIIDVQMPRMNGYELAELLRKEKKTQKLPILFLSAEYSDDYHLFKGYESAAVDLITKPYNLRILINKVMVFLQLDKQKRELAEKIKIEEKKSHLENILMTANNLLIVTSQEGIIHSANMATLKLLGYEEGEIVGMPLEKIFEDRECINWIYRSRDEKEKEEIDKVFHSREKFLLSKSGERRPVLVSGSIINGEGMISQGFVFSAMDITERKLLEEEKRALQEQLLQSQKMEAIGRLAGGIAHDLNNMLSAIVGNSDILAFIMDKKDLKYERVNDILLAANRANDLTMKLLTFARKEKIDVETVPIKDVIEKLITMLKRGLHKQIIIKTIFKDNPFVDIDEGLVLQALMNICINAGDAVPEGGRIEIETDRVYLNYDFCHTRPDVNPGLYCVIKITDTGTGISEDIIGKIFEPFFTTKGMGMGIGLGLSVTLGIIKNHDGYIQIVSKHKRGTTVEVYLPVSTGEVNGEDMIEEDEVARSGDETIMVVDDEDIVLRMAKEVLTMSGYKVITAKKGMQAIKLYNDMRNEISLILIDMIMPGMDGKVLFHKLKKINPCIRVVLSTGYTLDSKVNELMQEGILGFIQKPFRILELCGIIRKVLDS